MSQNGPDSRPAKPKQNINTNLRSSTFNRDKPSSASRHPNQRSFHQPGSSTDSLSTSYIPSPSPTKDTFRSSVVAKPRQDLRNRKSLSSAFRATANANDENRLPFTLSSSNKKPVNQALKPRRAQASARAPPRTTPKNAPPDRSRTKTPSPTRGRQQDLLVSPSSSASSPPRGLAESYQRILDEEDLAAQQDDLIDDSTGPVETATDRDHAAEIDRMRVQRMSQSTSPISLKTSRKSSPRIQIEERAATEGKEEPERLDPESGMYSHENNTNGSLDRAVTQNARDEERLDHALRANTQPFKKARMGEKSGLTVENLRRSGGSDSTGSTLGPGSASSRSSDPPMNIPRDWGRKGRAGRDWLNRINSRSGKFTGDVPKADRSGNAITSDETRPSERIDDWIEAAAEVPLPSIENESSQSALSSRGSTPLSLPRKKPSLDRIREWDHDEDFTARSLQISDSPPIRVKNTALERIREREIENLTKSAVTTNRLGELREKRSLDHIRRRSPSITSETSLYRGDDQTEKHRVRRSSLASSKPVLENGPDNVEQEQVPAEGDHSNLDEPSEPTPKQTIKNESLDAQRDQASIPSRRKLDREDSQDLLRRLARVTSAASSPDAAIQRKPVLREREIQSRMSKSDSNLYHNDLNVKPLPNGDTPSHEPSTTSIAKTQDETTPQSKSLSAHLKTPLVTGAWIDTPLPTGGRDLAMPKPTDVNHTRRLSPNTDGSSARPRSSDVLRKLSPNRSNKIPQLSLADTAPVFPKSTLAAIIERAKNRPRNDEDVDDTLILDESTIQSLEDLVANDYDVSDILAPLVSPDTPVMSPSSETIKGEVTPPESPPKVRLSELQSFHHLTSRLSQLGLSIRDAKKGISSLERAVSSPAVGSKSKQIVESECSEAGEFHDFIWPCERCGCSGRSGDSASNWQTVSIPIPKLWTRQRGDWRPRLTWLGVVTAAGWTLFIGESIARYGPRINHNPNSS